MGRRSEKSLTERFIASIKTDKAKGEWFACRDLPGFLLRAYADGTKTFAVRYRVKGTEIRRIQSLGALGTVTLTEARAKAREVLSAAALGGDPLGKTPVPTWESWVGTYYERLGAKSRESFHQRLLGLGSTMNRRAKRHPKENDPTYAAILARWGKRTIDQIGPADVETERQALREKGEATANRWLAVISGVFSAAVRAEIIDRNPCSKVRKGRENPPKSRTLSPEEMGRLLAALPGEADQYAVAGVYLALLGGARRGEALALRWDDVNLVEGKATLHDSKSGKPRVLPLVPQVVAFLEKLPRSGPYVVASENPKRPRPDLKGPWSRLVAAAQIEGATFHDLRRTFGREVNRAAGLRVAQEALGHQDPGLTASTYTPEGFSAVKAAAERMASVLPFPVTKTA